jgi:hypothetical protein
MRRFVLLLLTVALGVPALTLLPVVLGGRSADPHPVGTHMEGHALRGLDPGAMRSATGRASGLAAQIAWAETIDAGRSAAQADVPVGAGTMGEHSAFVDPGVGHPAVLTSVLRSRRPFQTVGVSWNPTSGHEPDLTVILRTHSDRGWTGWQSLEIQDAADDQGGASVRGGTEPAWVGPSDEVQVRVDVRSGRLPAGLQLELIDPGRSDFDRVAGLAPPMSAAATALQPQILSRRAWGANEVRVKNAPTYMPTIRAGVLHHTVDNNGYSASQVPAIIRGDYAYHLSRGWNDIGYNFLVDRFGRIWEGRRGGITLAVQGAHAGGFNTDTFGVSMIGNYDTVRPSAASVNAVVRLFAWKLDLFHRDPRGQTTLTSAGGGTSRYAAGTTVRKPVVMGHRDVGRTACPGRYLYPLLGSIRTRVAALMRAGLLEPAGPAPSVTMGTGASISARSLVAQSWRLSVGDRCRGGTVATVTGRVPARTRFTAKWNGRGPGPVVSRPGAYTMTLTSRSTAGTARPLSRQVVVVPPAPPGLSPGALSSGAGGYVPVVPRRLVDTRSGAVLAAGPGGRVDVPVLGRAGVPSGGVTSVVLQVTALCPTARTSLQVWPSGQPRVGTTTLPLPAWQIRSALVTAAVGTGGAVSIGNATGVTDLLVDVLGYHASGAGAAFRTIAPTRVYATGSVAQGDVRDGEDRVVTLPSLAGVAANQIVAVVADLTVDRPARRGTLSAYQAGIARPGIATLTFPAGGTTNVRSVIGVHSGQLVLHASGTAVAASLDVVGVYVAAPAGGIRFTALPGARLMDTRSPKNRLVAGASRNLVVAGVSGVPANASAVVVNLRALSPTLTTSITGWPAGQAAPAIADLRVPAGEDRANLAVIPVGSGGAVSLKTAAGSTDLIVDLVGYYD